MITLFSERPELNQRPYSFVISILVHGLAVGVVSLGILSAPRVKTPSPAARYAVRHLDLHTLESQMPRNVASGIAYPRLHSIERRLPPGGSAPPPPVLRQAIQAPPGPQTLVQPDLPKPVTLTREIPVPATVIWYGKQSPAKTLVPPLPEKPPVADASPSLQLPNEEQNLAGVAIAATNPAPASLPVLPSTTSPVVASGPKPTPPAPVTTAQGSAQPSSAAIMSLSDLHLAEGDIALPPVNESASSNSPGGLALAADSARGAGQHGAAGKAGGRDAGQQDSSHAGDPADSAGVHGSNAASGSGSQFSAAQATHISLPHDGQFGAVVVGSSLEEKYPETAQLWSGRMAYTVYLHVGLAKSWILQYSLSRDDSAAAAGNITHIEAPWPYNIVRPNLAPGTIDADALMIHGFVNHQGRFERLAVVFPPEFAQTQFVLNALSQWQFRPATQNGQNVRVEVLLIIPEEPE